MPGPYSSEGSLTTRGCWPRILEFDSDVLPITDTFDSYRKTLESTFAGQPSDVTEENIQARIRGNLLMALSNKFGSLVLSTGNKSEMAVGYCTLYGDMAGGLAVISDVPKTMVYELAKFVNRERLRIPDATLTKAPSAELRPNQTDQDTLPPYDVLDRDLEGVRRRPAEPRRNCRQVSDIPSNWCVPLPGAWTRTSTNANRRPLV